MNTSLHEYWLAASRDLSIRVTSPFTLRDSNGQSLEFDALVHDFGATNGMLILALWDTAKTDAATAEGYGYSCMCGGSYDRNGAIDMLRDWDWSGNPVDRPTWCVPLPDDPNDE